MGLSKLSKKCKKCPFVDTCEHKQMEALAFISNFKPDVASQVSQLLTMNAVSPVLRESINIRLNEDKIRAFKDKLEKTLRKSIFSSLD